MGVLARIDTGVSWGPAEQAAIDRCLTVPGLSARREASPGPGRLARTIETEIIPRLLLAHRGEPDDSEPRILVDDIAAFARIVLEQDDASAARHTELLCSQGHSPEAVLLDLLAPTARLLGDMWRDDLCSFTDVTIGLSRLQQVLRGLSVRFRPEGGDATRGRILLAPTPGEQHSFGISMLDAFFRKAGWEVSGGAVHTSSELNALAREEWLDAIGLSLSSDILFEKLRTTIANLRKASRNRQVYVIVGGRYFADHPDQARAAGADSAATDAPDALRQADLCRGRVPARR